MSTAAASVFLEHLSLPPSPSHSYVTNLSDFLEHLSLPPSSPSHSYVTNPSVGYYTIVIAIGCLGLILAVFISSVLFCPHHHILIDAVEPIAIRVGSVILPRVNFVAEDNNRDLEAGNAVVGLDQAAINSYPKFHFSKDSSAVSSVGFGGGRDTTCSICLCEYKEAEMLRMMPVCKHYFHLCCLDQWLKLNGSCPVCRNSPLPTPTSTPLSTPLSEVLPLSQYAADRRRARNDIIITIDPLA